MFSNGHKAKKILVVEDEPQIAEGLEARLTVEGYDVVLARDGQEGIEQARREKPDLIVMDVLLPRVNGLEACGLLKSDDRTKHIPVLVLTALQRVGDTEDAFKAGANDFLSKPFSNQRLLEKIHKLIAPSL